MKKYLNKKSISLFILVAGMMITVICCLYQYYYYHTIRRININEIAEITVDCAIEDIHWQSPDYDYITGSLSIDGKPVTSYPTKIIFYQDESDLAYYMPVKLRNYIEPEREQRYEEEKDVHGFMYKSREYLTNTGEPSDHSWFYVLLYRNNDIRRNYKIGFLLEIDGTSYLYKTGEVYAYYGI